MSSSTSIDYAALREANKESSEFRACRALITTGSLEICPSETRRKMAGLYRDLRPLYLEHGHWRLDDFKSYAFAYAQRFALATLAHNSKDKDWALSRIACEVAKQNPTQAAAMESLIDTPRPSNAPPSPQSLMLFLSQLTIGLAESDISAGLKSVKRIHDEQNKGIPYLTIAQSLAKEPSKKVEEILVAIVQDDDISLDNKFLIIGQVSMHAEVVFDVVVTFPDSQDKTRTLGGAFDSILRRDPQKAADRLDQLSKNLQNEVLPQVVKAFAPRDLKAAEAFARRIENLAEREKSLGSVAAYKLPSDAPGAFALIESLKTQDAHTLGDFLGVLGNIDLPQALALARRSTDSARCIVDIATNLEDISAAEELLAAPEIINGDPILKDRILRAIGFKLVQTSPEKAELYADQMTELRGGFLTDVIEETYANPALKCAKEGDLAGAEAHLNKIHNSYICEKALLSLVPFIGTDQATIERLASRLPECNRNGFRIAAAVNMAKTDLNRAIKMLKSNSLANSEFSEFVIKLSQKDLLLGIQAAFHIEDNAQYAVTIATIGAQCKVVPPPAPGRVAVGYADLVKPLPAS